MPEVKSPRSDEKTVGEAVALTRSPTAVTSRSGAAAMDPQLVALTQFRNIATRQGIGLNQQAIEKIADKFAELMSKDLGGSKSLTVLASPGRLARCLTHDEAVQVLLLAHNIFVTKKELVANPLRMPVAKPVDLPEILHKLVHSGKPIDIDLPRSVGPARSIYIEAM